MKRAIAVLTAIIMVVTMVPITSFAADTYGWGSEQTSGSWTYISATEVGGDGATQVGQDGKLGTGWDQTRTFRSDNTSEDYTFSADLRLLAKGDRDPFPKYGLFAFYKDEDNWVRVYFDARGTAGTKVINTYAKVGGQDQGWRDSASLGDSFDLTAFHELKVIKSGNYFRFYCDGKLVQERVFNLSGIGQIGLDFLCTQAEARNIRLQASNLGWGNSNGAWDIQPGSITGDGALVNNGAGTGWDGTRIFKGDNTLDNYIVSADFTYLGKGTADAFPKYGLYAYYKDEANWVRVYVDARGGNGNYFVNTFARVDGIDSNWQDSAYLGDSFDLLAKHQLKAQKENSTFKFYLDGQLVQTRTFNVTGVGQVGIDLLCTKALVENFSVSALPSIEGWGSSVGNWTVNSAASLDADALNAGWDGTRIFRSDNVNSNYMLTADLRLVSKGSADPFPKYGLFAYYKDDNNWVRVYLDARGDAGTKVLCSHAKINGQFYEWQNSDSLGDSFDLAVTHILKVEKTGPVFKFYVDGILVQTRTFPVSGLGQIGLDILSAKAEYRNIAISPITPVFGWGNAADGTLTQGTWDINSSAELAANALNAGWNDKYIIFAGDPAWTDYTIKADATYLSDNLGADAWPKYGMYACYKDSGNFVMFYLDVNGDVPRVATTARVNGQDISWMNSASLQDGISSRDYLKSKHAMMVEKTGSNFKFYVDGKLAQERNFDIDAGQYGLISIASNAKFENVTAINGVYRVELDKSQLALVNGETAAIQAEVKCYPVGSPDQTVTWSSSNTNVATVNAGVITAVGKGTAVITARSDLYGAEAKSTVEVVESYDIHAWGDSANGTPKLGTWTQQSDGSILGTDYGAGYKQIFTGDITLQNYTVSTDILWKGTGTTEDYPQYGIYPCYFDEQNYVFAFLDKSFNELCVHAVVDGVETGWLTSPLPDSFDYGIYHNIKVEKSGSTFKFYVDGILGQTQTFGLDMGQIGLVTRDANAGYLNVKVLTQSAVTLDKSAVRLQFGSQTTLSPDTGDPQDTFAWASSNPAVVTVDNGTLTAVGEGSATITVTSQKHGDTLVPATCVVTVPKRLPANKFRNPVAYKGEDPWVVFKDGFYYYTYVKHLASGVYIKIAKTDDLTQIGQEDGVTVWSAPATGWNSKSAWAPELHFIQGKWYIYYAGCDDNGQNRRMGVLESVTGDPLGSYVDKGKVVIPTQYSDNWDFGWAIDGTVLENNGNLYFIWSGWPDEKPADTEQVLYIATMSNPWTISSDRVMISKPDYDWEKSVRGINEGPQVLKRNGKIFVVYSANASWTNEYCLGMISCSDTADLLEPASWIKNPTPVFYKDPANIIYGPGHNSFVQSPDGLEDWIVYHVSVTRTSGWGREVRTQKFTWNPDGTPAFGNPASHDTLMDKPSGTGTADDVAAGIYTLDAPGRDITTMPLPSVPGFSITIKSSSNTAVVGTNGTISPPGTDITVTLILTVTKIMDGSHADTQAIAVTIPAKTPVSTPAALPASPAPELHNDGSVSVTPTVSVISDTGEVKAVIDKDTLDKAFVAATPGNDGLKVINIPVMPINNAKAYSVDLPSSVIHQSTLSHTVIIQTEYADLTIPSNMIDSSYTTFSSLSLSVSRTDTSKLPDEVKSQIGDRPLLEFVLRGGTGIIDWNNPNASVILSIPYKPSEEELKNPDNIVVWYIDGNGRAVPIPNGHYDQQTGKVIFSTTHFSMYAIAYVEKTYDDLSGCPWAAKPVQTLASKGVFGVPLTSSFRPGTAITRGEFIYWLVNTLGLTAGWSEQFEDVSKTDFYYEALGVAKKLGIAVGNGSNIFNPQKPLSRQDMMVLTVRALRMAKVKLTAASAFDLSLYPDNVKIADYARNDIAVLVRNGYISGDGKFINPLKHTTRAEAAALLYRLYHR